MALPLHAPHTPRECRFDMADSEFSLTRNTTGLTHDAPVLSALVVIPDTFAAVRATMRALRAQTLVSKIEIVFVVPTAETELPAAELRAFHSFQKIVAPIVSIARAYAAAVPHARAPLIALTEDHSFPAPQWAERLTAAHQNNHAVVAPLMRNGNPDSFVSWADFYSGYGKWAEPLDSQAMDFLPGHNSVYRRDILLKYLPRLSDLLEAETVLHWELRQQGHTLWLECSTFTRHLNFALWRPYLSAQWHAGRNFAAQRAVSWHWRKRAGFALGAPLIPFVRLMRARRDIRRARFSLQFRARLYVTLLAGLAVDGFAQGAGYLTRRGTASASNLAHEFHRTRYIKPAARKQDV